MGVDTGSITTTSYLGDCLEVMREMADNSVDLVIASPPYEDQRDYGVGFKLKGEDWVQWALPRYLECVRVCKGLVAWVVDGKTARFEYSATPLLLAADLKRAGVKLRRPPIYRRVGIFGSGGPDWWRADYELVICSSKGRLPWSDNRATGKPPKYPPGGRPSHRTKSGARVSGKDYNPPAIANPGNIVNRMYSADEVLAILAELGVGGVSDVVACHGGGGHFGSKLAHEIVAPFPESLVEPFILSFCKPGGVVLDCFAGSGTTLAVALRHGRHSIGIDAREGQVELQKRRLYEEGHNGPFKPQ